METIIIRLDYGNGPIWKECIDGKTGKLITGIDAIDHDETLTSLDETAQNLYASLYEFDCGDLPVKFNENGEVAIRNQLLSLVNKIKNRLAELNDGSFVVEDEETERLNSL